MSFGERNVECIQDDVIQKDNNDKYQNINSKEHTNNCEQIIEKYEHNIDDSKRDLFIFTNKTKKEKHGFEVEKTCHGIKL